MVVLLWTLLSLMSNIEDTFNKVWGITKDRSMVRKFTDYTALMLLLPVMMMCSAGVEVLMSDTVQQALADDFFSPVARVALRLTPWIVTWGVLSMMFYVIPNTRVNLRCAIGAGLLSAIGFQVLQWLFVTGQVYVSKYNAIYGSFAFLPLLLVWLQLSWLITLAGAALTYAAQNYYNFAHANQVSDISPRYADELALGMLALMAKRFSERKPAVTRSELLCDLDLPAMLADRLLERLQRAGLISTITTDDEPAYQPAYDVNQLTVTSALDALSRIGNSQFIAKADRRFKSLHKHVEKLHDAQLSTHGDMLLHDLITD